MPSLFDMFAPRDLGGGTAPLGWGDALAQRSNSLIGLGLGMMSPMEPGSGQTPFTNALRGFQAGSQTDLASAYRQRQLADAAAARRDAQSRQAREDAFRREEAARAQRNADRSFGLQQQQFERGDPAAGPPPTREVQDPSGQNVIEEFDYRTRQWRPAMRGGGVGGAAPVDQFTAGAGRSVYGFGAGDYGAPTAPATVGTGAGTQAQPVLAARKPLSAHQETAIEKADDLVAANQAVIGNLQTAKQLSRKAASGPFALERGRAGSMFSGTMFGEGGKETVMLHNIVANNAVEQLKAIFGGNPTEGERKILIDLQGSVNESDEVRQEIFDRAINAANERMQTNRQRAQQMRGGTYYRPGGGAAPQAPTTGAGGGGGVRRYNPQTGRIE